MAGAEYVSALAVRRSDRRYRHEFQQLALQLVPPGAVLLDFGAGPGIDARFYARHGLTVFTYDIDPRMSDYLAAHCRELVAGGAVRVQTGGYREFLARPTAPCGSRVALVTANFAPLCLIDDLHELFARFAVLTAPGAAVLASVLNPYFTGDLRYGWWWRNLWRLMQDGRYAVPGVQALIWRRRLSDFSRACSPWFVLEEVFAGSQRPIRSRTGAAWLRLATCRFMFLLFRKRAGRGDPR
jgi:SAM-dependent methyltransferase